MKVFIVMHGEKHEGGSVVGVYDSHEKAVTSALAVRCCFDGGWVKDSDNDDDEEDYWENGCDYVMVSEWTVK